MHYSISTSSSAACSPTTQQQDDIPTPSQSFFAVSRPTFSNTHSRRSPHRSRSITPIPEDDIANLQSPAEEEDRAEVNHELKSTLTDLLNCETVKRDAKTRLWVQTRLMEAEMELKRQRRRRIGARGASPVSLGEWEG